MPLLIKIKHFVLYFKKMDSELKKKLLSNKLKKTINEDKVIVKSEPSNTVSPYFSPRRTRNQKKIKYEESEEDIKKSDVKNKFKDNIKNDKKEAAENLLLDDNEVKFEISGTKRQLYTPEHMLIELQYKKPLKSKKRQNKKNCGEPTNSNLKVGNWEPVNWQEILANIKEMRSEKLAPVDTMGCDKCADEMLDDKSKRYHILVALMLSSQTKDQTTYDAMNRLKEHSLTPDSIVAIKSEDLEKLLCPVSFYKVKAKSLQKTAKILIEKYNSDIPNTIEDLINLPGVGPKMAHICMKSAWNIVTGIGVDVHVHRICNRLGWVRNTKNPEQTRAELESWLPPEHWCEVNHLLVGFGQTICTPLKPNCADCKNQNLCPSAFKVDTKTKLVKNIK